MSLGRGLVLVLQPGIGTTVQDAGRRGLRRQGIPPSGWLDGPLAEAANALVGNAGGEAVLELRGAGTVLRVEAGPVRLALGGAVRAEWRHSDGRVQALRAWHSATLEAGAQLRIGPAESGCAYLALHGGIRLEPALGSRSQYPRAGLSGLLGRGLRAGDALPCMAWPGTDPREWRAPLPWCAPDGPLRVMLGPQADHFEPEAVHQFLNQPWAATTEQDRMGLRLRGEPLVHVSPAAADIVSDGVVPGAVQVPANGQPIVLRADGQTVGGYPKIATVIQADQPRLAHLRPGQVVRFECVEADAARQALQAQCAALADWRQRLEPFLPPGFLDEAALYCSNLVSGVIGDM